MSLRKLLFVDRDGTLIHEPPDFQIDSLEKLELLPKVIPSLLALQKVGYQLVMVSNQDGLGTASYPQIAFDQVQGKLLSLFASQGVRFEAILICPHTASQACACRKPNLGLVRQYTALSDWDRERSAVIGDRETDLQLAANMGIVGIRLGEKKGWSEIVAELITRPRMAEVHRETRETAIDVRVNLDDEGGTTLHTGIGYFDHMLEQVAKHGGFALSLQVKGDLHVDEHHTVEDTALALGEALRRALGDKRGIGRYGFVVPMDEAEARVSLDLSGRAHLVFEGKFPREFVGDLPTEMVPHFFRSLADAAGMTLHIEVRGDNTHHMVESAFKGLGRALRQAIMASGRSELPSTKGVL